MKTLSSVKVEEHPNSLGIEDKAKEDIGILLVDDDKPVLQELRRILEVEKDLQVVDECSSAEEASPQVEKPFDANGLQRICSPLFSHPRFSGISYFPCLPRFR